jgi:predicted transposase YbfD/YdcC
MLGLVRTTCAWGTGRVDGGGEYVLAVKNNQLSLYEDVKGFDVPVVHCESGDWGHGRSETRHCWVVNVESLEWFKHTKDWKGLKSIMRVQGARRTRDTESVENRYFIASLESEKTIARAVRSHWSAENVIG